VFQTLKRTGGYYDFSTGLNDLNGGSPPKWIASDILRGLTTGLASEYNEKNLPCIEIPCGLAGGSLQIGWQENKLTSRSANKSVSRQAGPLSSCLACKPNLSSHDNICPSENRVYLQRIEK
jgi:hypothetical protein